MLVAAAALDKLADDLYSIAASYSSVLWTLGWLTSTAAQAEHITAQARTAASTSDTAFAATVTPPEIAASRARMASLIAGNVSVKTSRRSRPSRPSTGICRHRMPLRCIA
ncbi:PPE domain-containing protein [Mycobacterium riyadhense]|nr:PPE domain-containing protein [Mycobacterium riyadhense]